MVPLGLSQAATVRVAYEIGAGRPRQANRAGFVALALGILFMTAAALVLWTMPRAIIGVYADLSDPANRESDPANRESDPANRELVQIAIG